MKTSDIFKLLLWEIINPGWLKFKRNQKIRFTERYRGINLGCGFDNPETWLGLDGGASLWMIQKTPRFLLRRSYKNFAMSADMDFDTYFNKVKSVKFVHHDILYGLPFADETIPYVFSSHFFEHLRREEAQALLKECHRVMKKQGYLRIVVPSLDEAAESMRLAYEAYTKGDISEIQAYVTDREPGFQDKFSGHKWMYNFKDLKTITEEAGFKDITECEFRKGKFPDVEILDCRPGLIIEARKG